MQIQKPDGTSIFYDILCSPPQYFHEVTARLFVPLKRRHLITEVCLVQSPLDNPGTEPTRSAAGRRLLAEGWVETRDETKEWARRIHGTRFDSSQPGLANKKQNKEVAAGWKTTAKTTNRELLGFWDDVGDYVTNGLLHPVCFTPLMVAVADDCLNSGGDPPPLNEKQINQLLADSNFAIAINKWIEKSQVVLQTQADFNLQQSQLDQLQLTQNELQQNFSTTLQEGLRIAANNTDTLRAATIAAITDINANLKSGVNVTEAIAARQAQYENATDASLQKLANVSRDIAIAVNENEQGNVRKHTEIFRYTRKADGALFRLINKQQIRRQLASKHFPQVDLLVAEGFVPFYHPSYQGVRPTALTPDFAAVLIDEIIVDFINTTEGGHPLGGGIDVAHSYSFKLYCNVETILNEAVRDVYYNDFLELIGPINCTQMAGNTVDNCRCWLETKHSECRAVNPPRSFETKNTDQFETYRLQIADPMCAVTPPITGYDQYAGSWNNRKISSITDWHRMLSDMCSITPSANAPQAPFSANPNYLHVISVRKGRLKFDVRPAFFPGRDFICRPDLDYVFIKNAVDTNIVHAVYTLWREGYALLLTEQTALERLKYGLLPNYLTYESTPFQYLENNKTYECHRASVTMVSKATRPVYTVRQTAVNPLVTATAYSEPPVCGILGCTFGPPVSVEQTADVQVTTTFDSLLPDSTKTIVGDWWTSTSPPMTTIIDAPYDAAPVTTAVFARENKITYVWQPIPEGYSLANQTSYANLDAPLSLGGVYPDTTLMDRWLENNGGAFGANLARYSADIHIVPFSAGRCVAPVDYPIQWACEMFDHFSLHPLTNMRQGQLVLVPKADWRYEVTLSVVKGELVQRVFDGCPEFRYVTYSDGYQELEIVNSLPAPVSAVVRTTTLSASCPVQGDRQISLQPRQTYKQAILACGEQLITVYQGITGGPLQQCEQPLNITYAPLAQANVRRFVVEQTNRSFVDDAAISQFVELQRDAVSFWQLLTTYTRLDVNTELTTLERDTLIQTAINNYLAQLNATQTATRTTFDNIQTAQQALAPVFDRLDAINSEIDANLIAQAAKVAQINATAYLFASQVAELAILTDAVNNATIAKLIANQELIDALRDKGSPAGKEECDWCYNLLPGLLSLFMKILCPIVCGIMRFFIWIIIAIIGFCCCIQCAPGIFSALVRGVSSAASKAMEKSKQAITSSPTPANAPGQQPQQYSNTQPPAFPQQQQYYGPPPPPGVAQQQTRGAFVDGGDNKKNDSDGEDIEAENAISSRIEMQPLIKSNNSHVAVTLKDEDSKSNSSNDEETVEIPETP